MQQHRWPSFSQSLIRASSPYFIAGSSSSFSSTALATGVSTRFSASNQDRQVRPLDLYRINGCHVERMLALMEVERMEYGTSLASDIVRESTGVATRQPGEEQME